MVAGLPTLQVFISNTMMLRVFELGIPSCHCKHLEPSCSRGSLAKCMRVVIDVVINITSQLPPRRRKTFENGSIGCLLLEFEPC